MTTSIALMLGIVLCTLLADRIDSLKFGKSQAPKVPKLHQATVAKDVAAVDSSSSFANSMTASNFRLKDPPVYIFGKAQVKSSKSPAESVSLLGGKGANLAVMGDIGLSVPPGFTITTEVCAAYHENGKVMPKNIWEEVIAGVTTIEDEIGMKFGDATKPLLVSVRSGAAISMPGMMDTVLNLGINDETVKGLGIQFGDRFAMDSYRRFLHMFGTVVMGMPHSDFEEAMHDLKKERKAETDSDLTVEDLTQLVATYKTVFTKHGQVFLSDPYEQLHAAVFAVFDSWHCDRAIKYREAEGITGLLGTAVSVQTMVFGNMGMTSGTGVCFTRDPNTGKHLLYGEYLMNAQGEDVVAGIRTPQPIKTLKDTLPEAFDELMTNVGILESHYHDMQDIEFTIQEKKLWMLQTRGGKRTGAAAIKIALDLVEQGLATKDQAIKNVHSAHLKQLLHPQFSDLESAHYLNNVCAKGLPASPGAAVGRVVFSPEAAEASFAADEACILVRDETSPEDVGGMWASEGVLTARGGMTSHAAVVARGWGKPCICGLEAMHVVTHANGKTTATINVAGGKPAVVLNEGDWVSLNGDTGEVIVGEQMLKPPSIDSNDNTKQFMEWVDARRTIRVLANADTPADAIEARKNGAQGIGLTRTEHMFFSDERIRLVRQMIMAKDVTSRQKALAELLPYQRADFEGILEAMDGLPVTIRLLDPPLHEFLPSASQIDEAFAKDVGMASVEECRAAVERMSEVNPMLGLRGCRLGVVLPELVQMQSRALIEAALNNKYVKNLDPRPEIMVPLVSTAAEFTDQANLIRSTFEKVLQERQGQSILVKLGTMIETPRAALIAETIAQAGAQFFSYGTNDLTQMTYGFSRDDVGSFMPSYLKKNILERDPFEMIDQEGVGQLISMSMAKGREVASKLVKERTDTVADVEGKEWHPAQFKGGVCGEHGGDPRSVRFFVREGMDYVSCSPFRVPVARLAAAQAVIEMDEESEKEFQKLKVNLSRRRRRLFIQDRGLVNKMYKVGGEEEEEEEKKEKEEKATPASALYASTDKTKKVKGGTKVKNQMKK